MKSPEVLSPPELGHGTVAGGRTTDWLLTVSTRSAHLPGWLPDVFGSVSALYCTVVLSRWFGLSWLISARPAASPSRSMLAWATLAVATHEPVGTFCISACALP